jgi:hypothetical protein
MKRSTIPKKTHDQRQNTCWLSKLTEYSVPRLADVTLTKPIGENYPIYGQPSSHLTVLYALAGRALRLRKDSMIRMFH